MTFIIAFVSFFVGVLVGGVSLAIWATVIASEDLE